MKIPRMTVHSGEEIAPKTLKSILSQAQIIVDDLSPCYD
jgi:predicted RNA binding protein YcfA (HicA-like mRNA interferase family)